MSVEVRNNPAESRYEAFIDGAPAGVALYDDNGERVIFTHTETFEGFEGQGVGSALARFALGATRDAGKRVLATCPFMKRYMERHPESYS